jgi:hypothetical protein
LNEDIAFESEEFSNSGSHTLVGLRHLVNGLI